MIFLQYTMLVILQYKGMTTEVPDPCPNFIKKDIVTDMCKKSSAIEEANSGGFKVDSVVLRIMIQQDNCVCRVTLDNQIQQVSIGLSKYEGHQASAPFEYRCGLAVDINHIPDISTLNVTAPIECVVNSEPRNITLLKDSYLQFKSRIINGNFTRGYCMRIIRDSKSDNSQVLRITCDALMTTEHTTDKTTTFDPTKSSQQTAESVKSTTQSSSIDTTAVVPTTNNYTNIKHQQMTTTTDPTTGLEQTTYIAIGAGSGVALILLVVLVVICLRRKSTHKAEDNGNVEKSYQQEESDDKLPDNVLYVPATEFDITGGRLSMEGNYSTAGVDRAKSSNKRLSMEGNHSTADVDTTRSSITRFSMEGNYTIVDEDTGNSSNERCSMEGNYSTADQGMPKSSTNRLSMDGNYSTVKLGEHLNTHCSYPDNSELGQTKGKEKPTIKPKPTSSCINIENNRSPDQNIKHITPLNGSDKVYAVVDKSSKHAPTDNVGKGEATCHPDQTYAVVDKARKRKSNPDETNKKKFEINSGNKV